MFFEQVGVEVISVDIYRVLVFSEVVLIGIATVSLQHYCHDRTVKLRSVVFCYDTVYVFLKRGQLYRLGILDVCVDVVGAGHSLTLLLVCVPVRPEMVIVGLHE